MCCVLGCGMWLRERTPRPSKATAIGLCPWRFPRYYAAAWLLCDVCWLLVVGGGCCCFLCVTAVDVVCRTARPSPLAVVTTLSGVCVFVVGLLCRQSRQGERSEGVWKKEEGMRCRSASCVWVRWATQAMARSRAWHRRGEWALLLAPVCMYVLCCQGWWWC